MILSKKFMSENLDGILIVNKPVGLTSRDVVNRVSKILNIKRVGHTGTLDPIASGVLILTIGKATKLGNMLTSEYKEYIADFCLGYETDTLDETGKLISSSDLIVSNEEIENVILDFKGRYLQEVPAYSAVKVKGKRLYEYARCGIEIDLPKRKVDITDIKILKLSGSNIQIRVRVSKGTYIRSLVRDIGRELGTYATMTDLCRVGQGDFSIKDAFTLEDIEKGNYRILSFNEILDNIYIIDMDDELYKKVYNGQPLEYNISENFIEFTYKNNLIALYQKCEDKYRMFIKFDD